MIVPYQVDVPMARWPFANWVLIGVTVLVSLGMFASIWTWEENAGLTILAGTQPDAPEGLLGWLLLQPGHFHVTQLLGSTLIHEGILHLLGNMLFLWVFGNAVDAKLGHWRFLGLYALAAVFEGLVTVWLGDGRPTLGASGAIMGIVGAYVMLYPVNDISVFYWFFFVWAGVKQITGYWVVAFYVAFDIWGLITSSHGGIAYLAHVSGFAFGVAAAAALIYWRQAEPTTVERNMLQIWKITPEPEPFVVIATPAGPVPTRRRPPPTPDRLPPISLD